MTKKFIQVFKWAFIFYIAAVMTGCAPQTSATQVPAQPATKAAAPATEAPAQIANPASVNCTKQGGTLAIQKRGDGGEYGVCYFEDNRQCEEWALMRGECPVGGLKVTGFVTEAGQYCAITGGVYTPTNNTQPEQGTCTLKNGKTCDAADYFNGKCDANSAAEPESFSDPFAYCSAVGAIDQPDGRYTGDKVPDALVQSMIKKGIVTSDAPADFQKNAVWRCMDKSVWVCHFGANLPCLEKADMNKTPIPAMEDFCKANPTADNIPAATTGRATVYEWQCKDGKPVAGKQILKADPQGFLADFWYEVSPQ
jgi:putative hemolysin